MRRVSLRVSENRTERQRMLCLLGLLWGFAALFSTTSAHADSLSGPYIDSRYLTAIEFGTHSHYIQPWRAYLETVSANTFLNSVGIVLNLRRGEDPDPMLRMLAHYGMRHARIEIGWGNIDYQDESKLDQAAEIAQRLLACKRYHVRPMILLNANQGVPCPLKFFNRQLAASAPRGATQIQLTDTSGLIPGYSGLCNLTGYWAAEALITGIQGNTVTLSKPLPKSLGNAGANVLMATLKYRPFSPPDSPEYQATIAGWQRYVGVVARFVAQTLGTGSGSDRGFDMEVWNELTFGSDFLDINNYYRVPPYKYDQRAIWSNLVRATADYAVAHSGDFRGVSFSDGFSNTIPWPASSTEPPRVSALSHHPYVNRKTYPANEQRGSSVNALLQTEQGGFVPSYSVLFPEYFGCALQTETGIRDMAPITTEIYRVKHGRNARVVDGRVLPCSMWITEVGIAPKAAGISDPDAGLMLKAKTTARYMCFYINKGVRQLDLFGATGGDLDLGILPDRFLSQVRAKTANAASDAQYVSPALRTLGNIVSKMRQNLSAGLKATRMLHVVSLSDNHNHYQFAGDGTPEHPPLYNRELFAFLPYQVNAHRFVIPYYVMTRDVTQSLPPEAYTLTISGIHGAKSQVSVYDPIQNRAVPVSARSGGGNTLMLKLTATDYPYLLTIQER